MKPKYFNIKNGNAYIRDFKISDLAESFKTPLYLFDQKELEENMEIFKKNFQSTNISTHVVYASKAFLVPKMCDLLVKHHLWMDAVSLGDLYIAYKSNFPMNHIIFHGNNKSIEELEFAVKNDVVIVVDHYEELIKLIEISKKYDCNVRTMFRVNPGISAHTHQFIQTATLVSKFGESIFDDNRIDQIMKAYVSQNKVKLLGFHSHIGSQIHEISSFIYNVSVMMEFSEKIVEKYDYQLTTINFGGGFGIAYTTNELPLKIDDALKQMVKEVEKFTENSCFKPKEMFIEPGRSIIGESCIMLYTCGDFKHTYGDKNYLFVDGGMTDNIRPALYQAQYSVDIANKMNMEKNVIADIAGKCCESGDIVVENALIPLTSVGDILIVYSSGAYTYSMSSNYNSLLKPAVVFLDDEPVVVSRRETLSDLFKLF